MTGRRVRVVMAIVVCVVATGGLLIGGLSGSVIYFRTVSEAVASKSSDGADRLRIAGAVVPGTVETVGNGVSFKLTDGIDDVLVHHQGDPPELFADGAPVVSEGHWSGTSFTSDRLMIKHGSEYKPPDTDADARASVEAGTSEAETPP